MLTDELSFLRPFIYAGAGLIVLALLLYVWRRLRLRNAYERTPLFTDRELAFLPLLDEACGRDYRVFAKVRWADVIGVQARFKGSDWQRAFNRICAKRLDFVLCRPDDLAVMLVLELLPEGKPSRDRKKRDKQLIKICEKIGLPLIQLDVSNNTRAIDIRARIEQALKGRKPEPVLARSSNAAAEPDTPIPPQQSVAEPQAPVQAQEDDEPLPPLMASRQTEEEALVEISSDAPIERAEKHCPKCDSPMQKRTVSKGQYQGQVFWTCANYPLCKTVLPVDQDKPKAREVTSEGLFTLKATR